MGMMKTSIRTYLGLIAVFIASFGCAYLLPINQVFKSIAATPAIAALVAVIYQILKDQAAFERQDYLQRQQQIFNLGATSHMANTAFDKHVEFCEKYMSEVHQMVTDLVGHGPSEQRIDGHLASLMELKKQYAAWVPKDVALQLEPFEDAISEMSALCGLGTRLRGETDENRAETIKAMYGIFHTVLGIEDREVTEQNRHITVEEVKERIRSILGINELTKMRKMIVSGAIKFLEDV